MFGIGILFKYAHEGIGGGLGGFGQAVHLCQPFVKLCRGQLKPVEQRFVAKSDRQGNHGEAGGFGLVGGVITACVADYNDIGVERHR